MKSIFFCKSSSDIARVYDQALIHRLETLANLDPAIYTVEQLRNHPERFADVQYLFTTWGMPVMTEEDIATLLPSLQCVFYAAGTVQYFARPFLNRGVKVFSAWAANAVPVAEYTVAQILLANKGFYQTSALMSGGGYAQAASLRQRYPGNYGAKIGIIGAGMIGSLVIQLLKAYHLEVLVFDPFLPEDKATQWGVRKCSLPELFAECQVMSNHLANNAQTRGMLDYPLFAAMPPYATFLNTGRGAQVVEADLIQALTERKDLTAVLDVTDPEPPVEGSPLYTLPNCFLTPHIAGSSGTEVHRMAEYMAEEYQRYIHGQPCPYEVTLTMLETMA